MIASEIKLIPLSILHHHEDTVLRGLETLPIVYRKSLLEDPKCRYPFLYYLLFTYWTHLVTGEVAEFTTEDFFYNRYYWFQRLAKTHQAKVGFDASYDQQAAQMVENAECAIDLEAIHEIERRVATEMATNEKEIAVAYNDFSIGEVKRQFGLEIDETRNLFAGVAPVAVGSLLAETLRESIPLALAIGTEKARSELIIAPVLLEIRRQLANTVSLFSGVEWNVDPAQGLRGICDFFVSLSPEQLYVEAPVVTVVEAKKDDIGRGIGQSLAEMVAANLFNQDRNNHISTIYGVVTTGNIWKFLQLEEKTACVDATEYHIKELERIVGILLSMLKDNNAADRTAPK